MPFTIELLADAQRQLRELRAYDRTRILSEIRGQLEHQASVESRNRKQLEDHPVAGWELRVGDWRVFYDIEAIEEAEELVVIVAIGRKVRSGVMIDGKEIEL